MKILIIGNTGFVGSFLVERLNAEGHSLVGLDVKPAEGQKQHLCKTYIGDLLSPQDVRKVAKDVDTIISLAAKHHDFGVTRTEFFNVNKKGTEILLSCASELGIKKIIFYSTVAVYGTQPTPTDETTTPAPDSDYGESKLAAENLFPDWIRADEHRSVIIIRPTVVYGPRNYANVYNLIDKIYRKRFLFVGNGNNVKSIAYVENLVDANVFLIDKLKPGIQVFNYSDEPQMTISQIVQIITNCFSYHKPRVRIPLAIATTLGSALDLTAKVSGRNLPITAARMRKFATPTHHKSDRIRHMGFKQRISIEEGFSRMINWYLQEKGSYPID
jgi:nucleoside-diphosphate-sugar epimerase